MILHIVCMIYIYTHLLLQEARLIVNRQGSFVSERRLEACEPGASTWVSRRVRWAFVWCFPDFGNHWAGLRQPGPGMESVVPGRRGRLRVRSTVCPISGGGDGTMGSSAGEGCPH